MLMMMLSIRVFLFTECKFVQPHLQYSGLQESWWSANKCLLQQFFFSLEWRQFTNLFIRTTLLYRSFTCIAEVRCTSGARTKSPLSETSPRQQQKPKVSYYMYLPTVRQPFQFVQTPLFFSSQSSSLMLGSLSLSVCTIDFSLEARTLRSGRRDRTPFKPSCMLSADYHSLVLLSFREVCVLRVLRPSTTSSSK